MIIMPVELSDMQGDILYSFMSNHKKDFGSNWVALELIMEQLKQRRNFSNQELMSLKEKILARVTE